MTGVTCCHNVTINVTRHGHNFVCYVFTDTLGPYVEEGGWVGGFGPFPNVFRHFLGSKLFKTMPERKVFFSLSLGLSQ